MDPEQPAESSSIEPSDHPSGSSNLEPILSEEGSLLPFHDLTAPQPLPSSPPPPARWLAFAGIIVGGLLGGLIGYGVADLLTSNEVWAAVGGLVGGLGGAIGVGIVSALTLRAMNEWQEVRHPESDGPK